MCVFHFKMHFCQNLGYRTDFIAHWNLYTTDIYGTNVFVCCREVSAVSSFVILSILYFGTKIFVVVGCLEVSLNGPL